MMAEVRCDVCDTPMNHHGDLLVEPGSEEELARMDPALGGSVYECYTCPDCGRGAARAVGGE